ncbi:MAG: hypothetical protein ACTSRU_19590, partial [Candidatus Hodarchaeales archaeon]
MKWMVWKKRRVIPFFLLVLFIISISTSLKISLANEDDTSNNEVEILYSPVDSPDLSQPAVYDPLLIEESKKGDRDEDVIVSFKSNSFSLKSNIEYLHKYFDFKLRKTLPLING